MSLRALPILLLVFLGSGVARAQDSARAPADSFDGSDAARVLRVPSGDTLHASLGDVTIRTRVVGDQPDWPVVVLTMPTQVQVDPDAARPPLGYPYTSPQRPSVTSRFLMIVGRNLPQSRSDPAEFSSGDPLVSYEVTFTRSDAIGGDRAALAKREFANGWEAVERYAPPAVVNQLREMDAVILTATLKRGILPGRKTFTLNGSMAEWYLQFGDNLATMGFVRSVSESEQEPTSELFLPEDVRIQVRTAVELPLTGFEIVLGRNGSVDSPGGGRTISVRRSPHDPRIYLTPPLTLTDLTDPDGGSSGAVKWPVSPGDVLLAQIAEPALFVMQPHISAAVVHRSPALLSSLWKDALLTAARCKKLDVTDWSALSRAKAEEISNWVVFPSSLTRPGEMGSRTIDVRIRDHAAMLLLVSTFVEMTRAKEVELDALIRAYDASGATEPMLRSLRSTGLPLSAVSVKPPDWPIGNDIPFNRLLEPSLFDYLKRVYPSMTDAERVKYRADAIAEGLKLYKESVANTLRRAEGERMREGLVKETARAIMPGWAAVEEFSRFLDGPLPCNIPELLTLTGFGFDPVVARLVSRLVKLEETPASSKFRWAGVIPRFEKQPAQLHWVPDNEARAAVKGLKTLAEAVKAQEEYADLSRTAAILAASAVAVTLTAIPSALNALNYSALATAAQAPVAVTALAVDAVDAALTLAHEVPEWFRNRAEVRFALGASALLGTQRLEAARAKDGPAWQQAVVLLLTGIGTGMSALDAVKSLDDVARTRRVGRAADNIEQNGLDGLTSLSPADAGEVLDQLARARKLRADGQEKALSAAQKKLLEAEEGMKSEARAFDHGSGIPEGPPKPPELRDPPAPLSEPEGLKQVEGALADAAEESRRAANRRALLERFDTPEAARAARDRAGDMEFRRRVLEEIARDAKADPASVSKLNANDLNWLSGRQRDLTPEDVDYVHRTLHGDHGGNWKQALKDKGLNKAQRHRLAHFRKKDVDAELDGVIRQVERETGARLNRSAFGSNTLSSDYDLSVGVRVEGQVGAERVVRRFNERFREKYGKESGTVYDTNVYTDPVYNLVDADRARGFGLSPLQADEFRQWLYSQMSLRKKLDDAQWAQHVKLLEDGAPDQLKSLVRRVAEQIESNERLAARAVDERLGRLAGERRVGEADPSLDDLRLRAQNEEYARVLDRVEEYQQELRRLSDLPPAGARIEATSDILKPGVYRKALEQIHSLVNSGRLEDLARARRIQDRWRPFVANRLRNAQGQALYFASEAYQTEGAISHVVGEIQAKSRVDIARNGGITAGKLMGDPVKSKLTRKQYVDSYYENRGSMLNELNHGRLPGGGFDDPLKAAGKASKYLIRQLDAAHQSGVKLTDLFDRKLVEATIELDKARGTNDEVRRTLERLGMSAEDFVRQAEQASDALATRLLKESGLASVGDKAADYLRQLDEDLAMEGISTPLGRVADGGSLPPRVRQEQELLDETVAAARGTGMSAADIERALGPRTAFSQDPIAARQRARAALERQLYDRAGAAIVTPQQAAPLRALAHGGAADAAEIARLRSALQQARALGDDLFESMRRTFVPDGQGGFRRAYTDQEIDQAFDLAARNNLLSDTDLPTLRGGAPFTARPVNSGGTPLQRYNESCGLMVAEGSRRDAGGRGHYSEDVLRNDAKRRGLLVEGEGMRRSDLADWLRLQGADARMARRPVALNEIEAQLASGQHVIAMIRVGNPPRQSGHWVRVEGITVAPDGQKWVSIGDPASGKSWRQRAALFEAQVVPSQYIAVRWPKPGAAPRPGPVAPAPPVMAAANQPAPIGGTPTPPPPPPRSYEIPGLAMPAREPRLPPATVPRQTVTASRAERSSGPSAGPREGSTWTAPDGEKYDLGEWAGAGKYADVIEIKSGPSAGDVIKVFGKKTDQVGRNGEIVELSPDDVVRDVVHGAEVLAANDIPHARVRRAVFDPATRMPYLVQEALQPARDRVITGKDRLSPEQQRAVADLLYRMASRGIVMEDARQGNLFLRQQEDGSWVAGVLDTDRIAQWGEVPSERLAQFLEYPRAGSFVGIGSLKGNRRWVPQDAVEYMSKVLEYGGWIKYGANGFSPGLIEPQAARDAGFRLQGPETASEHVTSLQPPWRDQPALLAA